MKMESNCSRPLTTLSGGQTFLVSLAFALALSDLRKVNFSIETLLIDEGFGALDRNYVEMAVDTLELLKAPRCTGWIDQSRGRIAREDRQLL